MIQSKLREQTGCSVIALVENGLSHINPDPSIMLEENLEIILIGTVASEKRFMVVFDEE